MIYPKVNLNEWKKRYNLEIKIYHCPKCQNMFKTIIPVMTKDSAGLQSPVHECGEEYWMATLRPRTNEAKEFWDEVFYGAN